MVTKIQTDANAPWKRRFRAPSIDYSKVASAAPERGIVGTNQDGLSQVYAWDVRTGALEKRTDAAEGILGAHLSPDGRFIYYLDEFAGDQTGHFVRIPFKGGQPEDITPDLPPYDTGFLSPFELAFCPSGDRIAFTAGMEDSFRVYIIDLDQDGNFSHPREVYTSEAMTTAPILSCSGEIFVIGSVARPQLSLLAFDTETGQQIGELWEGDEHRVSRLFFSPVKGDTRLAAITTRTGIERLVIWNPVTGERIDPTLDEIEGAMYAFDWSADGKRILCCTFNAAVQQLCIYEVEQDKGAMLNPPPGTIYTAYFNSDGDIHSHLTTTSEPVHLALLDGKDGSLKGTLVKAGEVPPGKPWSSFRFSSRDGQEIQGWVSVPDGEGPFPLILETGPGLGEVLLEGFFPDAQAWLDHGFAWASINCRGSTTFGKDFEEQIRGNFGELAVEDLVAARETLAKRGIADPGKTFLTGWSYGGFLALLTLGKYPDLWAGGLTGITITDWALMYEIYPDGPKQHIRAQFGGTPDEVPEQYAKSSPVTFVQDVKAPVLIVQGRKDTGTPAGPIEIYEEKMKALGKEIEVHWFDAGHLGIFAQVELRIELQELMMQFAYDILQKSGS